MQRFFEILPGALAWFTLIGMVIFSAVFPTAVAIFIILFDVYWLLKVIYLSFHLRHTFSEMRRNMKLNWISKLKEGNFPWEDVYHLILLPMYEEPYAVIKESFESLLHTNYPKEKFLIVLATEERAGEKSFEVAKKIEQEFKSHFFKFLVTKHPVNLPGEIPGKGSNESWAGERAREEILNSLFEEGKIKKENLLVSVFDIDTQVFPEYFGRLTYSFLEEKNHLRAIYQPIPFFTNNIYQAPALARVVSFSATFWQMMQQSRPERLTTFSSQSIPYAVLEDIGFWHRDVVSEDSRIFWQGYLHYHGDFRVVPLFYPVSMDANVAPTFWKTLKNLYKQQRRWGWGAENIPYMLRGFGEDKQISQSKKWYWSFIVLEGFHSWATNALMIFALGWLPVVIGGAAFQYSLLSYNLPQITRFIVELSMIGVASSAVLGIVLLPPKPEWFRFRHYFLYVLQWIFIPVTLIIFGAMPGLDAQTRLMIGGRARLGFWVTPKGRKPKSEKGVGEKV